MNDAELLSSFGEHLGISFQLQDDILDVYGDPEKFGKQVGGDIISNKKTFLLIKALELARSWLDKALQQQETAIKFSRQLDQLLVHAADDGYQQLQQRTQAGVDYFMKVLEEELLHPLQQHISEIKIKQKVKKEMKLIKYKKSNRFSR